MIAILFNINNVLKKNLHFQNKAMFYSSLWDTGLVYCFQYGFQNTS